MSAGPQVTRVLDDARAAFARSDWEAAREHFQRGLDAETSAEALDGLGQTLWWLGEEEAAIELRTKAFAEYQRRGDADAAANVAIYLAAEYRIAGNASVANGRLAIDGDQQLVALHPTEPVQHEVCEEQPPLGTRQRVLDPPRAQLHHEPSAELDLRPDRLRHR